MKNTIEKALEKQKAQSKSEPNENAALDTREKVETTDTVRNRWTTITKRETLRRNRHRPKSRLQQRKRQLVLPSRFISTLSALRKMATSH